MFATRNSCEITNRATRVQMPTLVAITKPPPIISTVLPHPWISAEDTRDNSGETNQLPQTMLREISIRFWWGQDRDHLNRLVNPAKPPERLPRRAKLFGFQTVRVTRFARMALRGMLDLVGRFMLEWPRAKALSMPPFPRSLLLALVVFAPFWLP